MLQEPHVHHCLQRLARLALAWGTVRGELAWATLVAPLACLTVLFNSLTAVFWLGEPFLRRDLLGLTTMIAGVTLVVLSSTFAPVAPVTPTYIATVVAFSPLPRARKVAMSASMFRSNFDSRCWRGEVLLARPPPGGSGAGGW